MLNKKIEDAINKQINAELFSSYLYYSMSAYCDSLSLGGFAAWMRAQALEEMTHVHKFVEYLNNRGKKVILSTIEAPKTQWNSVAEVFDHVYSHEVHVSGLINKLMDVAIKEGDHASVNFLQWFVSEQVEEEATADAVVQKLKLIDKTSGGLFMLDKELGGRALSLPSELLGGEK